MLRIIHIFVQRQKHVLTLLMYEALAGIFQVRFPIYQRLVFYGFPIHYQVGFLFSVFPSQNHIYLQGVVLPITVI